MNFFREVVVYSRKGCHLCEIVKETLNKLQPVFYTDPVNAVIRVLGLE